MRKRWLWLAVVLIALLCVSSAHGAGLVQSDYDDDEFDQEVEIKDLPGIPIERPPVQSKTLQQEFYDEDEFEGFQPKKAEPEPIPTTEAEEALKIPARPKFGIMEVVYISFIAALLTNYFAGKSKNEKIATKWAITYQPLLTSYFAKFGEAGTTKYSILKESAFTFSLTASGGRPRCAGAMFTLDLNKRHDLTSFITTIFNPHKDQLIVDVAMNTHQPFCFGVAKKREEKLMLKNNKDVAEVATAYKPNGRIPNYAVYTDSPEILETLFSKDVLDILSTPTAEKYFSSMTFSDRSKTYHQYKSILRIVINLPPAEEMARMADMMRLVFAAIEAVSHISVSGGTKERNTAMRKKLTTGDEKEKTEHELRQEAAQKKKQDKAAQKRAAYEKMTPEQQARYDEKEAQKSLKARQSKVKVLYS